jgi:hypothetical protein
LGLCLKPIVSLQKIELLEYNLMKKSGNVCCSSVLI